MSRPRIWVFTPYCHNWEGDPKGSDIGVAYNSYMALIRNCDWAAMLDQDAMPCSRTWFRIVEQAIYDKPEAGAFVGVTNRLNPRVSGWQLAKEVDIHNNDMEFHWKIGASRESSYKGEYIDVTKIYDEKHWRPLSGFCFIISKKVWLQIGGAPTKQGLSQVDYAIHRRIRDAGLYIYMLPALYLYHWYRYDQTFGKLR